MDRRRSARNRARIDVLIACEGEEGGGVLADLSYSGARVEGCSLLPPVGAEARLYLFVPGVGTLELEGAVSRHCESGFALACELHDVPRRRQVDRITALLFAASTDRSRVPAR